MPAIPPAEIPRHGLASAEKGNGYCVDTIPDFGRLTAVSP